MASHSHFERYPAQNSEALVSALRPLNASGVLKQCVDAIPTGTEDLWPFHDEVHRSVDSEGVVWRVNTKKFGSPDGTTSSLMAFAHRLPDGVTTSIITRQRAGIGAVDQVSGPRSGGTPELVWRHMGDNWLDLLNPSAKPRYETIKPIATVRDDRGTFVGVDLVIASENALLAAADAITRPYISTHGGLPPAAQDPIFRRGWAD